MDSLSIAFGVFLFSLPFYIITIHALKRYKGEKNGNEINAKKHVCYTFFTWSIGFTSAWIGAALVQMSADPLISILVVVAHKLFDAFNVIGCFFFVILLTDFIYPARKHIPVFIAALVVTLALIFITPSGVLITPDGHIPWRST